MYDFELKKEVFKPFNFIFRIPPRQIRQLRREAEGQAGSISYFIDDKMLFTITLYTFATPPDLDGWSISWIRNHTFTPDNLLYISIFETNNFIAPFEFDGDIEYIFNTKGAQSIQLD